MNELSPEERAELRELLDEALPRPTMANTQAREFYRAFNEWKHEQNRLGTLALDALPRLLDQVNRLEAENTLFRLGEFKAHSGRILPWKIECDALTDGDLATLAHIAHDLVGPWSGVIGVPTGGLRFAEACAVLSTDVGPVLIVDDVLTTGGSMEEYRAKVDMTGTKGLVIFARGQCAGWVTPIFTMSEATE